MSLERDREADLKWTIDVDRRRRAIDGFGLLFFFASSTRERRASSPNAMDAARMWNASHLRDAKQLDRGTFDCGRRPTTLIFLSFSTLNIARSFSFLFSLAQPLPPPSSFKQNKKRNRVHQDHVQDRARLRRHGLHRLLRQADLHRE